MNYKFPLMSDSIISRDDRKCMSDFCMGAEKFTYSKEINKFEHLWSMWQGCKYSVFVNSGSSANMILVNAMKILYGTGLWVCQSTTWATNICPILQLGMPLQLCDTDIDNFGPDVENLELVFYKVKPKFIFLTHLLGFPCLSKKLFNLCAKYGVHIVEDCCEAHGATFEGEKVGNFGQGSTFSFFYGHHMTTVEGGMVSTNNEKLYHLCLLLRGHGLLRELPEHARENKIVDGIDPVFTFLEKGYNFRNTELYAMLGSRQLARLDANIIQRNKNLHHFFKCLDSDKYKTDFKLEGVSSFCLPLYCFVPIDKVRKKLEEMSVEFRPLMSGNLYRHPFINDVNQFTFDKNSELLHNNSIYIGNHQGLQEEEVSCICDILNRVNK